MIEILFLIFVAALIGLVIWSYFQFPSWIKNNQTVGYNKSTGRYSFEQTYLDAKAVQEGARPYAPSPVYLAMGTLLFGLLTAAFAAVEIIPRLTVLGIGLMTVGMFLATFFAVFKMPLKGTWIGKLLGVVFIAGTCAGLLGFFIQSPGSLLETLPTLGFWFFK